MNMTGRMALHKGDGNVWTYRISVKWRWRTLARATRMTKPSPRPRWYTVVKLYIPPADRLHYVGVKAPEGWR